jgi:uncharacterized cupin superfamily protein
MNKANVFSGAFEYDDADPDGYRAGVVRVGSLAGGKYNVVKAFEVPPGQSICPYHYEYEEEGLFVLEGEVVGRDPAGEHPARRGDLICFPPGPDGAHKISNRDDRPAHMVMFSSSQEPAVAVYPDSDKIGVWTGRDADALMLRRADGHVEYYDGES